MQDVLEETSAEIKKAEIKKSAHLQDGFVCGHWPFDCDIISFDMSPIVLIENSKKLLIPPSGVFSDNFFNSKKISYIKYNGIPIAGIIGGPGPGGPDRPF